MGIPVLGSLLWAAGLTAAGLVLKPGETVGGLICGLVGNMSANYGYDAAREAEAAIAGVFRAKTTLDGNHTILIGLRQAHFDAVAALVERWDRHRDRADPAGDGQAFSLRDYVRRGRAGLTPARLEQPSTLETAVFTRLTPAFQDALKQRAEGRASAVGPGQIVTAVIAELEADLGEALPPLFAALVRGEVGGGWLALFVEAASGALKTNPALGTIWTAERLAAIDGKIDRVLSGLDTAETAAERRHREVLEAVAQNKGVDPDHLRPILDRLGHQDVPPYDIPRVLAAAVDQLQAMARERSVPSNDGADIDAAIVRARAFLAGADAAGAVAELDRALNDDEVFQAAVKRRVRLLEEKAGIQRAAYDHEGALATLEEIVRLDPDQTWRHIDAGDICMTVGPLRAAQAHFAAAFAAAERSSNSRDLAVCHSKIGDCLRNAGDSDGALAAYCASHTIHETLVERDPVNTEWQRDLSISYERIGDCLYAAGDGNGALAAYIESRASREALAGRDPDNPQWRRDLAVSHGRIGNCLRDARDHDGALAAYRTSLVLHEALAARCPGDSQCQRDLSISNNKIGDCLLDAGDRDGALAAYRDGLVIAKALAAGDPGNTLWQRDLSFCHNKIGDCLRDAGDRGGALAAYRHGFVIRKALAKRDPGNAQWQRDLIVTKVKLSTVDLGNTIVHLTTALEVAQRLQATGRLAPVDAWMPAELERLLAAARAQSPQP